MPKSAAARDDAATGRLLRHWQEAAPDDRMAHLVKDATRAFLRALQVRLARHDVALGHWAFLRILWQRDGLTKHELSVEAGVAAPTTVVALRAMQALDYVRLEQRPDNRKNVYVFLTPQSPFEIVFQTKSLRSSELPAAIWIMACETSSRCS